MDVLTPCELSISLIMPKKVIKRISSEREHQKVLLLIEELEKQTGNEKELDRLKGLLGREVYPERM